MNRLVNPTVKNKRVHGARPI